MPEDPDPTALDFSLCDNCGGEFKETDIRVISVAWLVDVVTDNSAALRLFCCEECAIEYLACQARMRRLARRRRGK